MDPPRATVPDAVSKCRSAGIQGPIKKIVKIEKIAFLNQNDAQLCINWFTGSIGFYEKRQFPPKIVEISDHNKDPRNQFHEI
jgi:hypothetical protein